MTLTVKDLRDAEPRDKQYKLTDRDGLYVLVHPNGGKYFRYDYRFGGKRKTLALGTFPETSLRQARDALHEAKQQVKSGLDPALSRRIEKAGLTKNTFEAIAVEFLGQHEHEWSETHYVRVKRMLEADVIPWLGNRPVSALTAPEVLEVLRRIEKRGALESAARTKQIIGQVLRYAIATGRSARDVAADLRGALKAPTRGSFAAIEDPKELGALLRAIDNYEGSFLVRMALALQPYVFARPGNLVSMMWDDIDLDTRLWELDAEKMKMRRPHAVPLSTQAISILNEIRPLTGSSRFVFASFHGTGDKHICREAPGMAIRRMGYKGRQTMHGFRTTGSTLLHEAGFRSDMIEKQLAHSERNKSKAAYDRSTLLPERRQMMQHWGNFLEKCKE
ncbi:integrase arm-type DNA-binding domain-containing protein [Methylotuvimicrobium sp. KM2]|uniref:tyrosine-type recombinase/integrase n=1 Tax=Methylotuvimicrobium sp. KM2 TaxID=3133976 RepID=UPI0031019589